MEKTVRQGIQSDLFLLFVFALSAHCVMFFIFLYYHIDIMTYFNGFSIVFYIILVIMARINTRLGIRSVLVVGSMMEVIIHQVVAIICVGNGAGFQYFFIMVGIIVMMQSEDIIHRKTKIITCSCIVAIMILVVLHASDHEPIYQLPNYVQQIFLATITLVSLFGVFSFALNQWNISELYRKQIETLLGERNTKIIDMQAKTIRNFADLVEQRDDNTGGHIKRISAYVEAIIDALTQSGRYQNILTSEYSKMLVSAAPLHDIGKIAIRDEILRKKGKLTDEEYDVMKTHAAIGASMLETLLGDMESDEFVKLAIDVARHHHERWNGRGYPDQLKGSEIPLSARIMAVADVFDALTSARAYKDKFSLDRAYEIMESEAGQQFDAVIITEFVRIRPQISAICRNLSED